MDAKLREREGESLFEDCNWYVTLVVSQTVEVADEELLTDFAFPESGFALAREAEKRSKQPLDLLATLVSTTIDLRAFSQLVLDDRVHLFADGKRPVGVPVFSTSGEASVTRGAESVTRIGEQLKELSRLSPRRANRQVWLSGMVHWAAQVLVERDPSKRFLWSFVALEVLTNKLFEELRDDLVARLGLRGADGSFERVMPFNELLWAPDRAPIVARYAVVAVELFPEEAVEDTATFRELKRARDQLSHGSLRNGDDAPVGKAFDLLQKYLGGAVKKFLLL